MISKALFHGKGLCQTGPGVTDLKPGDRVSSIPSFSMTHYGTYGEVAVLPA